MTQLTFNETSYQFKLHFGDNFTSLDIFVNGELKKVKQQVSVLPDTIEECLELIRYYDI